MSKENKDVLAILLRKIDNVFRSFVLDTSLAPLLLLK